MKKIYMGVVRIRECVRQVRIAEGHSKALFPLTPALSLREREKTPQSPPRRSESFGSSANGFRDSLCHRERAGVRGNEANAAERWKMENGKWKKCDPISFVGQLSSSGFAICLLLVAPAMMGQQAPSAAPVAPPPRTHPHLVAPIDTNSVLRIEEIVSAVLSNNAGIKAARANWNSMRERVPQARAWDDPRFGVDVERMGTTRLADYSDAEWMLSQAFPLSGKNRLRARVAETEAGIAYEEIRRRELDLVTRAKLAYFSYASSFEQLELNTRNIALMRQFAEISRLKYEVGNKTQSDVLNAETEAAKLEEAQVDLVRGFTEAQSQINVLMNRQAFIPLGAPLITTSTPPVLDFQRLAETAFARRPELESNRRKFMSATDRIRLAKREWIPDPELRLEARQTESSGGRFKEYDTGIFFNIPWVNRGKYKAAVREAELSRESAEQELNAMQTELIGMLRDQIRKIQTLEHHVEVYRGRILPLARQALDAARNGYETDKASFLDLITAQRSLAEAESMYAHHLNDYEKALVELDALIGAPSRSNEFQTSTKEQK